MALTPQWLWIGFVLYSIVLGRSVCTSISGGGGGGRWAYWPGGIFLITPRLRAVQGIVDTLLTRSLS